MSAILSEDALNDFIAPGVACIKPIEPIPAAPQNEGNEYEVTTEDKVAAQQPRQAQISLTDCLACSGCVTSAEAVLVSMQSHTEVLGVLDAFPSIYPPVGGGRRKIEVVNGNGMAVGAENALKDGKLFVASVSPQARASLAAAFDMSAQEAGNMLEQLLCGHEGVASGGRFNSSFTWVIDTNVVREACLVAAADEVLSSLTQPQSSTAGHEGSIDRIPKQPILTSACPGWICYAEKERPHILPYLSRLKSPQALTGTLIKSVLSRRYGLSPDRIYHLAIMPCFDKKLEASRAELTSTSWLPPSNSAEPVRDVDTVLTPRDLLSLASARNISLPSLPRMPTPSSSRIPFPDPTLDAFLFPRPRRRSDPNGSSEGGTSGGYLWHVLRTYEAQHPGSRITTTQGRLSDIVEYAVVKPPLNPGGKEEIAFKAARYYGFRNITNLVRRLRPGPGKVLPGASARMRQRREASSGVDYAYVEVMACPGGCTNGGGQVKVGDVIVEGQEDAMKEMNAKMTSTAVKPGPREQKAWLARVDEAYFSGESSEESGEEGEAMDVDSPPHEDEAIDVDGNGDGIDGDSEELDVVDGISRHGVKKVLRHWSEITGVDLQTLVCTGYRKVESDVGKKKGSDVERVAGLASSIGGGW